MVGIPMGTDCAPRLADIILYSYEAEFIQTLLSTGRNQLPSRFNFTYRYIDDVSFINNPELHRFVFLLLLISMKAWYIYAYFPNKHTFEMIFSFFDPTSCPLLYLPIHVHDHTFFYLFLFIFFLFHFLFFLFLLFFFCYFVLTYLSTSFIFISILCKFTS